MLEQKRQYQVVENCLWKNVGCLDESAKQYGDQVGMQSAQHTYRMLGWECKTVRGPGRDAKHTTHLLVIYNGNIVEKKDATQEDDTPCTVYK